MKHCELLNKNLFAYAEKDLPADTMQLLDSHVRECSACAARVKEFAAVMAVIDTQKSIEPRPFAETRIMEGIQSKLQARRSAVARPALRILQPVVISLGIAAAILIGYAVGNDAAFRKAQSAPAGESVEAFRSDLNVPEFVNDEVINFTE